MYDKSACTFQDASISASFYIFFPPKQLRVPDISNHWDNEASICHIPEFLPKKNDQLNKNSNWGYFYLLKWLRFWLAIVMDSYWKCLHGSTGRNIVYLVVQTLESSHLKLWKKRTVEWGCLRYLQALEFGWDRQCIVNLYPYEGAILWRQFPGFDFVEKIES